jgi:hypothetical protein
VAFKNQVSLHISVPIVLVDNEFGWIVMHRRRYKDLLINVVEEWTGL